MRLLKHAVVLVAVAVLQFRHQAGDRQRVAILDAVKSDTWSGGRQR